MRKIILSLLLFMAITPLAWSATNNPPVSKTNWQVTFIELGSVNCVPCKMMQPVMNEIEEKYAGVVKVVFYDVWTPKDRDKAVQYGIRAIPTQVFLNSKGKEIFRHLGYFSSEEIIKLLESKGIKPSQKSDNKK